jgi:hypothetical protein
MRWPGIETIYGPTLRTTTVFGPGGEGEGDKRWEDLHARVIEHVGPHSWSNQVYTETDGENISLNRCSECPRYLAILYPHHTSAPYESPRPYPTGDRRRPLPFGGLRDCVCKDR